MCIQLNLEKKYKVSKRNFLDDYANYLSKDIDMTLSGKYLFKYPKFTVNYPSFSNYPTHMNVKKLILDIKVLKGINTKDVVIGTGANGIVQNIIKILFKDGGNLVTPFLTFNQPEYAVTAMGGFTKRVNMNEDCSINIKNIIQSVDTNTRMIYICNPNNPTGIYLDNEKIRKIAKSVKVYVVIDESAIEFSGEDSIYTEEMPDNIVVVRSLSKAYGLANLRVGYMICSKQLKKMYDENVTVNEVSGISCEYARKVIACSNFKKNVDIILTERKKIEEDLKKIGFEFYTSKSNVLFSKTKIEKEVKNKFDENNISVVFVEDEFKKLHFRIAVQHKKTNKVFTKICKKILKKQSEGF